MKQRLWILFRSLDIQGHLLRFFIWTPKNIRIPKTPNQRMHLDVIGDLSKDFLSNSIMFCFIWVQKNLQLPRRNLVISGQDSPQKKLKKQPWVANVKSGDKSHQTFEAFDMGPFGHASLFDGNLRPPFERRSQGQA